MEPISLDESDSIRNISGPGYIPPVEQTGTDEKQGIESGVSSIEKSKGVAVPHIPSMEIPFLMPPSSDMAVAVITSKDASGVAFSYAIEKGMSEITGNVIQNYSKNLEEIRQQVQEMLRSPTYIQNMQILRQGDQIQAVGKAGVSSFTPPGALDRTRVLEKVPQTAEIPSSPPIPPRTAGVIPLVASVLIGGGLAIGLAQSTTSVAGVSSSPLVDTVKLVSDLQPVFVSISPQDIVPLINLMIAAPIYYHSWKEAVSGGATHKDQQKMAETAKKFAEDVIRMVSDPSMVLKLVYGMKGAESLSLDQKEGLANLLRFVMLGTALGMLYAVEVGKVQGGQYRGIMAEEVRALLFGDLSKPVGMEKGKNLDRPLTPLEQLSVNLARYASLQLSSLSPEDRVKAANILLDYMEDRRDVEHMLDPSNVFQDFYSAFNYQNPAITQLSAPSA